MSFKQHALLVAGVLVYRSGATGVDVEVCRFAMATGKVTRLQTATIFRTCSPGCASLHPGLRNCCG